MTDAQNATNEVPVKLNRRKWLTGVAAAIAGGGVAALQTSQVQRSLVYSPKKDFEGNALPPIKSPKDYGLTGVVAETWNTKDGDSFLAWHSNTLEKGKKTLVFFPGNGGHLGAAPLKGMGGIILGEDSEAYVKLLKEAMDQGYQIVAVHPVGFEGSNIKGSPTQANMFQGAEATIDKLLELGIAPQDMYISGLSMGTTLAAHAANHLSQSENFQNDPNGQINLTLVNGVISIRAALEETAPVANLAVQYVHDNLDTGKELREMGSNPEASHINVAFVRGADDKATPESQISEHADAAKKLNFRGEEVPNNKHYVAPKDILRQFDELERGNFEIIAPDNNIQIKR